MNLRTNKPLLLLLTVLWMCGGCSWSGPSGPPGQKEAEPSGDPGQSGIITVVTNRTDMIDGTYKEYAQRFHELHPEITVQFEAFRDYDKSVKIRLASGEAPDVMLMPSVPASDLPKFFAPLDDLELDGDMYFKDFRAYEGVTYGIPSGVAVTGLIYHKKVFEQAGITELPQTPDAFFAVCERLKLHGVIPLASNFKDRWPLQVWMYDVPLLISGDGAVKTGLASTDTPFHPESPYVAALEMIRTLYDQGYLEPNLNDTNWERSKRELAEGKIGMMLTGNWAIPQIIENGAKPEEIGFIPFPANPSGIQRVTLSPDRYYAVSKSSKHQGAAKTFITWMLTQSGYENYAGYIPVMKSKSTELQQLLELESYRPQYVEIVKDTDELSQILNKAQLDMPLLVQDYLLGAPAEVLDRYNQQWAKARSTVLESH